MTGLIPMPISTGFNNKCTNGQNCGYGHTTDGADKKSMPLVSLHQNFLPVDDIDVLTLHGRGIYSSALKGEDTFSMGG